MDVEKRLTTDAEVLAKQVESIDFEAYLERVFAVLDALDDPEPPSSDTEVPAGCVNATSRASAQKITTQDDEQERWELRELRLREREATEEGKAWSCRRAAELLETMNRLDEAAVWWRRAAAAGDLDAREYVADYLDK